MTNFTTPVIQSRSGWRPRRLRHFLLQNDSGVWGDEPDGMPSTIVLRSTDITVGGGWSINDPARRTLTEGERRNARLRAGDLVVVKSSGSALHLGKTALTSDQVAALNACYSNFVQRLRVSPEADPRFVWYLLNSQFGREQLVYLGTTTTGLQNLNGDLLGQVIHPGAPVAEQRAIAAFLDAETAHIDALAVKKRELIAKLLDRWTTEVDAVFSHHPGIPFKRLLRRPLAYGVLVPVFVDNGVPMLRINNLASGRVDLDSVARIDSELSAEYSRTVVAVGDLVVSVVGTLGRTLEINEPLAGANLNRPLARVQLNDDVPRSLIRAWFGSSQFKRNAEMATASDSAQPTLGLGDLKSFRVHIPNDPSEWIRLTEYLERREPLIRTAQSQLTRQMDLLLERRQALITAAVTGQIEIPGVAA